MIGVRSTIIMYLGTIIRPKPQPFGGQIEASASFVHLFVPSQADLYSITYWR